MQFFIYNILIFSQTNGYFFFLFLVQRASEILDRPCTGDSTDSSDNDNDPSIDCDSSSVSRVKSISVSDRILRRGSTRKKVLKTCAQYTTHNLKSVSSVSGFFCLSYHYGFVFFCARYFLLGTIQTSGWKFSRKVVIFLKAYENICLTEFVTYWGLLLHICYIMNVDFMSKKLCGKVYLRILCYRNLLRKLVISPNLVVGLKIGSEDGSFSAKTNSLIIRLRYTIFSCDISNSQKAF